MKLLAVVFMLLAAGAKFLAPAHADPTPAPSPGYQIPTPAGPVFPGVQSYPPRCLVAPLSCSMQYDAGSGTWNPSG
jgi:hypothetical protein